MVALATIRRGWSFTYFSVDMHEVLLRVEPPDLCRKKEVDGYELIHARSCPWSAIAIFVRMQVASASFKSVTQWWTRSLSLFLRANRVTLKEQGHLLVEAAFASLAEGMSLAMDFGRLKHE